jgi:tetratricopeptide (TPR) repeat protein
MRQTNIRAAAVLLACAATLSASAADCGRQIAASGPPARTIVLAGGDAWSLFRQFLAEIERRDLEVSLRTSRVVLSHGGRIDTIELGWSASLPGQTPEKLWRRNLSGIRADVSPQLLADARVSNWDIVCTGTPSARRDPKRSETSPAAEASQEAVVFFKSGVQYASRGDYANALREFKAAEKLSPRFNGLLMNLGVTYLQLEDFVRASEYLRRAVEQNPRDAAAHYNLACLQARLGQSADAIASLNAAKTHGMKLTASVRRDPDLSSLRGRRDFETLFEQKELNR